MSSGLCKILNQICFDGQRTRGQQRKDVLCLLDTPSNPVKMPFPLCAMLREGRSLTIEYKLSE